MVIQGFPGGSAVKNLPAKQDTHPAAWTILAWPASLRASEAEPRDQEDFPGLRWTQHSCSEHPSPSTALVSTSTSKLVISWSSRAFL